MIIVEITKIGSLMLMSVAIAFVELTLNSVKLRKSSNFFVYFVVLKTDKIDLDS